MVSTNNQQVSSAPPPTIPKYALPALEAPPTSSAQLLMLEAGSPFSQSQSPSSHISPDCSHSQSTSPSPSESGDADVSSSEASEAGKRRERTDEGENGKEGGQDMDLQGVFLTQVHVYLCRLAVRTHSKLNSPGMDNLHASIRRRFLLTHSTEFNNIYTCTDSVHFLFAV